MAISTQVAYELHCHQQQQQQAEQKSFRTVNGRKPLFLENYLSLLHSPDHDTLTADHLNQIISIHGFKKFKLRKEALEAAKAIKLIDPSRSTLKDNVSSKANVTLEEVIKDLTALNWQECSVTSIRSINSENCLNPTPFTPTIATKSATLKVKKRHRSTTPMATTSLSLECSETGSHGRGGKKTPTQKKKKKTKKSSKMPDCV